MSAVFVAKVGRSGVKEVTGVSRKTEGEGYTYSRTS